MCMYKKGIRVALADESDHRDRRVILTGRVGSAKLTLSGVSNLEIFKMQRMQAVLSTLMRTLYTYNCRIPACRDVAGVHPVSVRRFPSCRTQPLENLSHYL